VISPSSSFSAANGLSGISTNTDGNVSAAIRRSFSAANGLSGISTGSIAFDTVEIGLLARTFQCRERLEWDFYQFWRYYRPGKRVVSVPRTA